MQGQPSGGDDGDKGVDRAPAVFEDESALRSAGIHADNRADDRQRDQGGEGGVDENAPVVGGGWFLRGGGVHGASSFFAVAECRVAMAQTFSTSGLPSR